MKSFSQSACPICGKVVSNNGFARTSHYAMHARARAADQAAQMSTEQLERELPRVQGHAILHHAIKAELERRHYGGRLAPDASRRAG